MRGQQTFFYRKIIATFAGMGPVLTPPYLKKGDTIAIVAPARRILREETDPFASLLEKNGYKIIYGNNLFGSENQFSGSPEERRSDILAMMMNPRVKAIFAARGGYGTAQLLQGMDWEIIRDNPKRFIGFSDATALHSAFGKFMETVHGVMPYSLVMKEPQDMESFQHLFSMLEGDDLGYNIPNHPMNVEGFASGPLTGGNLSVLYSLAGSRYEPDFEGKILFLEDLDEYIYHIDRMLLNFELRDIFRKIAGLVIGDFSDMHDNEVVFGKNTIELIAERAQKYNIPSMFGFPSGHKKLNFPLIFGRVSTLTVKKGNNSLLMY